MLKSIKACIGGGQWPFWGIETDQFGRTQKWREKVIALSFDGKHKNTCSGRKKLRETRVYQSVLEHTDMKKNRVYWYFLYILMTGMLNITLKVFSFCVSEAYGYA
jgi:hypothetical protein